jgi:serine/threonine protein kinase
VGFFDFLSGKGKDKTKAGPRKVANIAKRFELSGKTGQGSMSKVYRAYDREIGRNVCLKILDKVKTKEFEARFPGMKKPSEGEICMALRHENIMRTYEHGVTTNGEPYIVMEWVDGYGLSYLIETRNAQLKGNRINYLSQLSDALQYIHDSKYLHRDLCARNIMVNTEGVIKLIDFGLTIPYTPQFCAPGNRTGTKEIMAPELLARRTTDHRIDMFALGVTAYEMFTFALPWERSMDSNEYSRRVMNTPPKNPKDVNKDLDDETASLLLKAIAKVPTDRYGSAKAFKEALEKLPRQDW